MYDILVYLPCFSCNTVYVLSFNFVIIIVCFSCNTVYVLSFNFVIIIVCFSCNTVYVLNSPRQSLCLHLSPFSKKGYGCKNI